MVEPKAGLVFRQERGMNRAKEGGWKDERNGGRLGGGVETGPRSLSKPDRTIRQRNKNFAVFGKGAGGRGRGGGSEVVVHPKENKAKETNPSTWAFEKTCHAKKTIANRHCLPGLSPGYIPGKEVHHFKDFKRKGEGTT